MSNSTEQGLLKPSPIKIAIVTGLVAAMVTIGGQYLISLQEDFFISADPGIIEAKPIFFSDFLPESTPVEEWLNISMKSRISEDESNSQATVRVKNIQSIIPIIKNYKFPVSLKYDVGANMSSKIIIKFQNENKEVKRPPFDSKMFVYVTNADESLEYVPITLEGIGGDKKVRECIIYVNYKSPRKLTEEGIIKASVPQYSMAIDLFEKAIVLDPGYAPAYKAKGIVYYNLGKFNESNNESGQFNYFQSMAALNNYIGLNNSDKEVWNFIGMIFYEREDFNVSINAFNKAIGLDHNYSWAFTNKGKALNATGQYVEALKAYDNATQIDPSNIEAWLEKGKTLNSIGKRKEAIYAFKKTIYIYNKVIEDSGSELQKDPFKAIDPKELFNKASNYVN